MKVAGIRDIDIAVAQFTVNDLHLDLMISQSYGFPWQGKVIGVTSARDWGANRPVVLRKASTSSVELNLPGIPHPHRSQFDHEKLSRILSSGVSIWI